MSTKESQKRLANSRIEVEHYNVQCADLPKTLEAIAKHGAENVKLEITPGLDKEGFPDLHFLAVPHGMLAKDCGEGENCSTTCPPKC